MKPIPSILLVILCAAGLRAAEPMTIDGYAAIVNQHVITVGQVMELVLPMEEKLRSVYSGRELAAKRVAAYSNGVQRLIEQRLIVEEFNKNGGQLPERLVDDRINEIIHDRFGGNRSDFLKTLAAFGAERRIDAFAG